MPKNITVVGLGPGTLEQLSLGVWDKIKNADKLLLQSARHPVVNIFDQKQIIYNTYDDYYMMGSSFMQVYNLIADSVINESFKCSVTFAVPGHPLVAEPVVDIIKQKARENDVTVEIIPSMSFINNLYTVLDADIVNNCKVVDGMQLSAFKPDPETGYIVYHIFDRYIATEVKLELMDYYPTDHPVTAIRAAGIPDDEAVEELPLTKLGSIKWIDHFTSIYVPPLVSDGNSKQQICYPLDPIVNVMTDLRGEKGCPWDLEQDHESLTPYLLEESYEVLDALHQGDMYKFCEELGDLLLQIVFHAQIARENKDFNINQVIKSITKKMIYRHPHVFGDDFVENSSQVLENWDKIKQEEKGGGECDKSILDDVPMGPALFRALKVQKKAGKVGFDWPDANGALSKVEEEQQELIKACENADKDYIQEEMGDLLFSIVNLSRFFDIDAEVALTYTVNKFIKRFKYMEDEVAKQGKKLKQCGLEELDKFWEKAKSEEN
ncbi:MAG: nucleoside triphosphate pyrophosphohydrolase [Clostridiales bacterium]|nr:nucleoside triphosphate pyrophosphohydrolase [Clostridiales bacterium]MCF8021575.1 nucleoside triphosphate pyrophosphohydrolase [Clostridiales bacterium]